MAKTVSLAPPQDALALDAHSMSALLKYVNSAQSLPTTFDAIVKEFSLNDEMTETFRNNIKDLALIYGNIRKHSSYYKGTIHPAAINLVDDLVNYADSAKTYYKEIYDKIISLDDNSPEVKKKEIYALIDKEVQTMNGMKEKASKIVTDFHQYESESSSDATTLQRDEKALQDKMNGPQGVLAQAEKTLKELEDALEKSGNKDKLLQKFVEAMKAQIKGCKAMLERVKALQDGLRQTIDRATPALKAVQLMQGAYGAIADDLSVVKTKVDEDIRSAKAIIADIQIGSVLQSWEILGDRAREYKKIASVDPGRISFDPSHPQ